MRGPSQRTAALSQEAGPHQTPICLDLGLPASSTVRNNFCCLQTTLSVVCCYSNPNRLADIRNIKWTMFIVFKCTVSCHRVHVCCASPPLPSPGRQSLLKTTSCLSSEIPFNSVLAFSQSPCSCPDGLAWRVGRLFFCFCFF